MRSPTYSISLKVIVINLLFVRSRTILDIQRWFCFVFDSLQPQFIGDHSQTGAAISPALSSERNFFPSLHYLHSSPFISSKRYPRKFWVSTFSTWAKIVLCLKILWIPATLWISVCEHPLVTSVWKRYESFIRLACYGRARFDSIGTNDSRRNKGKIQQYSFVEYCLIIPHSCPHCVHKQQDRLLILSELKFRESLV